MNRRELITGGAALAAYAALETPAKAWTHGAAAAPPSFSAGGVNFDGATWLVNNALVSLDSTDISFSFWLKYASTSSPQIWTVDPENTYASNASFNLNTYFYVYLADAATTSNVTLCTPEPTAAAWHHFLFSGDTNHAAGAKVLALYIDGVSVGAILGDMSAAFTMIYNTLPLWIGSDSFSGDEYTGDMAELWIAPGQTLLTAGDISPATVAKFYNAGAPVDLGADGSTPTGTAPAIYFHKTVAAAASTWSTNLGTGGSFSTTGTLTNSATNP